MDSYKSVRIIIVIVFVCANLCNVVAFKMSYTVYPTKIDVNLRYHGYRIYKINFNKQITDFDRTYQNNWINDLSPCKQYELIVFYVNDYNQVQTQIELITTPSGPSSPNSEVVNITQGIGSLKIELNYDHIDCVERLEIFLNKTKLRQKSNISKHFVIKDLLPCTNYELEIRLSETYKGPYVAYNNFIKTINSELKSIQDIHLNNDTNLLTWSPMLLSDCTSKYEIHIKDQITHKTSSFNVTSNEYKLDHLPGCSLYQITIEPQGRNDLVGTISIKTNFKDPSCVTNVTANEINETAISVKWNHPTENPACVRNNLIKINNGSWINTKQREYTITEKNLNIIQNIDVCASKNCISCVPKLITSCELCTEPQIIEPKLFLNGTLLDVIILNSIQSPKCPIEMIQLACNVSTIEEEKIKNLNSSISFACRTIVKNKNRWSKPGETIIKFTKELEVNDTIQLNLDVSISTSISISWNFTIDTNITIFIKNIKSDDKPVKPVNVVANHQNHHTFENLKPNTNYSIGAEFFYDGRLYKFEIIVTTRHNPANDLCYRMSSPTNRNNPNNTETSKGNNNATTGDSPNKTPNQTNNSMYITLAGLAGLFLIIVLIGLTYWHKKQTHQLAPDVESNCTYIEIENFPEYFYNRADYNFIENEFKSIDNMNMSQLTKRVQQNYTTKNRYTDITPYDYNRVILAPNEYCTKDYINASYIDGYKQKNRYIATQGPKQETAYDFWHMVVEQKCKKIIMLTRLQEAGITKCFKYFPNTNETLVFNDLTITNVGETNFGNFMQRALAITKNGCVAQHFLIHYQYLVWPDHGCPAVPLQLIEFVEFAKCSNKKSTEPVIVHCSAGVGRTGTFIALDMLLQNIQNEKYLSICETVRKLRMQRTKMVQTIGQYEFIYTSILLCITLDVFLYKVFDCEYEVVNK